MCTVSEERPDPSPSHGEDVQPTRIYRSPRGSSKGFSNVWQLEDVSQPPHLWGLWPLQLAEDPTFSHRSCQVNT